MGRVDCRARVAGSQMTCGHYEKVSSRGDLQQTAWLTESDSEYRGLPRPRCGLAMTESNANACESGYRNRSMRWLLQFRSLGVFHVLHVQKYPTSFDKFIHLRKRLFGISMIINSCHEN